MIGSTVSHYRILEKLGEGGMGVVYKAEDTKLKRIVALKFLPSRIVATDEDILRFQREAEAISALNHPHIATIHDVDEIEGQRFLVLEYLPCGTLEEKMKQLRAEEKQFPIDDVLEYGIQIAEGLAHAHDHQIIHRDVKTANMMLTENGKVKITDFGLAKLQGVSGITKTGSTVGTAAYMSPEQIRGEDVDQRSDIYSFGVVLYELTTSHLPFRAVHEVALTYSIMNENPPSISAHRSDVSLSLEDVINKCLEKNKTKRYQNANDIVVALNAARQEISGSVSGRVIHKSKRRWIIAVSAIPVLALFVALYFLFIPSSHPTGINAKTIAVLPFTNMSSNPEEEYFSEGITDDILTQLCKVADLNVISRTTMARYKGSKKSLREIGEELHAGVVLEGSVRRDGNNIRITSQLIDAANDRHLWAETYDREMKGVFAIQSEIAQKIASALQAKLSSAEKERLEKPTTSNTEVYNLLLQGRYFFSRQGHENYAKAVDLYNQALSIDPNDARVWASLSLAYSSQADQGYIEHQEGFTKARQAAEKSLSIDDKLAEAHRAMGLIKRNYDADWTGADIEYQKAITLEPGNSGIISSMAALLETLGKFDEAITLARKSIILDPVYSDNYHVLGWFLIHVNRMDEAAGAFKKALELNPQRPISHAFLGLIYLLDRKPESAIAEIQTEPEELWRLYGLAITYHGAGRKTESDSALKECIRKHQKGAAFQIAEIYAYRGEIDRAFEWLERAYAQRDGGLTDIKGDPFLKNIEHDPRYTVFMKKMKLPI